MYSSVRCDKLDRTLEIGEKNASAGVLRMPYWESRDECGTTHCLAGGYLASLPCATGDHVRLHLRGLESLSYTGRESRLAYGFDALCREYGIGQSIARFVFTNHDYGLSVNQRDCREISSPPAQSLREADALSRLAKVAKYLRRKQELWAEHEWWQSQSRKFRRDNPQPRMEVEAVV